MPTAKSKRSGDGLKPLVWPLAGLVVGVFAAMIPTSGISLAAGIAAWCTTMVLVLVLAASAMGARVGAFLAGVSAVVPCYVVAPPILRGLLACSMAAPMVVAGTLVLVPPIPGWRARLAHLLTGGGKSRAQWRRPVLDRTGLRDLVFATIAMAAFIAVVKATSPVGVGMVVRWLAGGFAIFALAEMASAGLPLVASAVGVTVPPLMRSPYRSTSIGEFWARRWNLWASELLFRRCCFAPLARRSAATGLWSAFFVSAVGHALLTYLVLGRWGISLTCGAFFLLQPVLIAAERRLNVRRWRVGAQRIWALTALAITSPLIVEPVLQLVEEAWGPPDSFVPPTLAALGFVICGALIAALTAHAAVFLSCTECPGPAALPISTEPSNEPHSLDR